MRRVSWSWVFREWLLEPITYRMGLYMSKETDAREELRALLDAQETAIGAVEEWVAADDETDASKLQPLIAKAQANNQRLAEMTGTPVTVDPPSPVAPGTPGDPI